MKNILLNSGLVMILSFLFCLPFLGEGFIGYDEQSSPLVLGAQTSTVKSYTKDFNVVKQFDYNINLAKSQPDQTLYDVVPAEYLSDNYKMILVYPDEIKDAGVKAALVHSSQNGDLNFEVSKPLDKDLSFPLSILITK